MYYEVLLQPKKPLKIGVLSTVSKNISMEQVSHKNLADGNFSDRHKLIVNRHCHGKTLKPQLRFQTRSKRPSCQIEFELILNSLLQ